MLVDFLLSRNRLHSVCPQDLVLRLTRLLVVTIALRPQSQKHSQLVRNVRSDAAKPVGCQRSATTRKSNRLPRRSLTGRRGLPSTKRSSHSLSELLTQLEFCLMPQQPLTSFVQSIASQPQHDHHFSAFES